MKTRLEEVEELIAETNGKIGNWLWDNHFQKEPQRSDMWKFINLKVQLEIEKHELLKGSR